MIPVAPLKWMYMKWLVTYTVWRLAWHGIHIANTIDHRLDIMLRSRWAKAVPPLALFELCWIWLCVRTLKSCEWLLPCLGKLKFQALAGYLALGPPDWQLEDLPYGPWPFFADVPVGYGIYGPTIGPMGTYYTFDMNAYLLPDWVPPEA